MARAKKQAAKKTAKKKATKKKVAKKKTSTPVTLRETTARSPAKPAKKAMCLRLEDDLRALVQADAKDGDRSLPGQVRRILKLHYMKEGLLEPAAVAS